jgi:hypothetical protein
MANFTNLGSEDPRTKSAMRGANPENFNVIISGHSMRPPIRMLYIHTVSRKTLPPIRKKLFPGLVLRGCENGERWVTCAVVPDPVTEVINNEMTGNKDPQENDGWRAVIDLLNPSNTTADPFLGTNNPDFFANRNGNNLIAEGFWPSLHKDPPEEEIKRAESNRDKRYQWLTREVQRLAGRSTRDRDEFLQTYPETYTALDMLGIKTDYHTPPTVTATCPNCGDAIKQGLAFHKSSATERLCVIDPEKAYKAKAITREEFEELATAP